MSALAASLGFFGLDKFVKAEPKLFRYTKFFQRCDEATLNEFKDFVVIDKEGKSHKVPTIWGTDDKAAAAVLETLNSDIINLPLMNLYRGDIYFLNGKIHAYYHLTMRSLYEEDMNMMLEQAVRKFNPMFNNRIGEYWLFGVASGEQNTKYLRVCKQQLTMIVALEGTP